MWCGAGEGGAQTFVSLRIFVIAGGACLMRGGRGGDEVGDGTDVWASLV